MGFRVLAIVTSLLCPSPVWAVQGHGGAEGLIAHQIGHVFFVVGICYLLYKINQARYENRGWFEFKTFLWLLIGWNLLTFSGHWMREHLPPGKFVMVDGHIAGMTVNGLWDLFFYLTRLDHLLLVPAFLLLFLALRKWRLQS